MKKERLINVDSRVINSVPVCYNRAGPLALCSSDTGRRRGVHASISEIGDGGPTSITKSMIMSYRFLFIGFQPLFANTSGHMVNAKLLKNRFYKALN